MVLGSPEVEFSFIALIVDAEGVVVELPVGALVVEFPLIAVRGTL